MNHDDDDDVEGGSETHMIPREGVRSIIDSRLSLLFFPRLLLFIFLSSSKPFLEIPATIIFPSFCHLISIRDSTPTRL